VKILLSLALFVMVGCGQENLPSQRPEIIPVAPVQPKPPAPGKKVILAVFGAEWCTFCKRDLPAVQAEFDKLPADQKAQIEFRFYDVGSANRKPTVETAERYRDSLHLTALAFPDPWQWQLFRKWVGKNMAIPGGAVLDKDEKVLQSFVPGMSFIPKEIVRFAASKL